MRGVRMRFHYAEGCHRYADTLGKSAHPISTPSIHHRRTVAKLNAEGYHRIMCNRCPNEGAVSLLHPSDSLPIEVLLACCFQFPVKLEIASNMKNRVNLSTTSLTFSGTLRCSRTTPRQPPLILTPIPRPAQGHHTLAGTVNSFYIRRCTFCLIQPCCVLAPASRQSTNAF